MRTGFDQADTTSWCRLARCWRYRRMAVLAVLQFEARWAMGIDILDVSYRIEKVLSVKVSNDDWELLSKSNDVAVGDLYDLLLGRLGLQDVARNDFRMNHEFWLR